VAALHRPTRRRAARLPRHPGVRRQCGHRHSSGKGDRSRLYKTTDGCQTWKLVFTNPDKDGFWDALAFDGYERGFVLGDPVAGRFALFFTLDRGKNWGRAISAGLAAPNPKSGAFAASNSALTLGYEGMPLFGTSGPEGAWLYLPDWQCTMLTEQEHPAACFDGFLRFDKVKVPIAGSSPSAGVFSIAIRPAHESEVASELIAVGGDYRTPETHGGAAVLETPWSVQPEIAAAQTPTHGYRSAVAHDSSAETWISVGPNGTDISTDDGRNWRAVHPNPALHEAPDADRSWNALSLPFVVGPKGRIGELDAPALSPAPAR